MDYLLLYGFVKLDDIRLWLDNTYGVTFMLCLVLVVATFFYCLFLSEVEENDETILKKVQDLLKSYGKYVILCFVIQFFFNLTATILPSTGQMAAIYLGTKAAKSDTAEVLSRLPKKYALLLEKSADDWLSEKTKVVEKVEKEVTELKPE